MLQNDGYAVGMGQGTAAQVVVSALQLTVMEEIRLPTPVMLPKQMLTNAHAATAADN